MNKTKQIPHEQNHKGSKNGFYNLKPVQKIRTNEMPKFITLWTTKEILF